jgi:hypothetical protein
MKKKITDLVARTRSESSKAVNFIGDLNGDGKVDKADWEIARGRAKDVADEAGRLGKSVMKSEMTRHVTDEAARLGRAVMRSDMTRDVATGAAIGAAVAIPVPIVGPGAGAVVGAGIGLYKNLTKSGDRSASAGGSAQVHDPIDDLARLDDLRQRGILTDDEFQAQKRKLLRQS